MKLKCEEDQELIKNYTWGVIYEATRKKHK